MGLLVDTSVWSTALRRDAPAPVPEVTELKRALEAGDTLYVTGLILQELLQGLTKPKAHRQIIDHFKALPLLVPDREDHIQAAALRSKCRGRGLQAGAIDALLAQLCIRHRLTMLSTDHDFRHISKVVRLSVWA